MVLLYRRPVMKPEDLTGLKAEIIYATEKELRLRLPDGRVVKVFADYECVAEDCSDFDDPYTFIDVREVRQEVDDLGV